MKLAVMQPYVFPYIGYFQLVNVADIFVFYDDVNFIKRGWINRNKILINHQDKLFTIPCKKASQNRLINEIRFDSNQKEFKKLIKTISYAYKKAPYYDQIFPLIDSVLKTSTDKISNLAQQSVIEVSKYLGIQTEFKISSLDFPGNRGLGKADRLIDICKKENANQYLNPIGGKELYEKTYFKNKGIQLNFIKPQSVEYAQFKDEFVPWLSIIDVLMFNSIEEVKTMLSQYELV